MKNNSDKASINIDAQNIIDSLSPKVSHRLNNSEIKIPELTKESEEYIESFLEATTGIKPSNSPKKPAIDLNNSQGESKKKPKFSRGV